MKRFLACCGWAYPALPVAILVSISYDQEMVQDPLYGLEAEYTPTKPMAQFLDRRWLLESAPEPTFIHDPHLVLVLLLKKTAEALSSLAKAPLSERITKEHKLGHDGFGGGPANRKMDQAMGKSRRGRRRRRRKKKWSKVVCANESEWTIFCDCSRCPFRLCAGLG